MLVKQNTNVPPWTYQTRKTSGYSNDKETTQEMSVNDRVHTSDEAAINENMEIVIVDRLKGTLKAAVSRVEPRP